MIIENDQLLQKIVLAQEAVNRFLQQLWASAGAAHAGYKIAYHLPFPQQISGGCVRQNYSQLTLARFLHQVGNALDGYCQNAH
jgi:hypothetical protein